MKDKKTKNIRPSFNFMDLALVLLCAVLVMGRLMGGLYAAYTTKNDSGDSARVIKFGDITLTESPTSQLVVIPGVDIKKSAKITFDGSESATYVFVEIALVGAWTFDSTNKIFSIERADSTALMSWTVSGDWDYVTGTGSDKKYAFYKHLTPNTSLIDVEIIDGCKVQISEEVTKTELDTLCSASISITATVVQSIGFESVGQAWSSVSGS
ncbi:MAG: hypothetical protein IJD07_04945 [Clostridia bacterium]|nr:hypothetical protein [Clostridia bacterium]